VGEDPPGRFSSRAAMASASARHCRDQLESYGVAKENVRLFGQQNPKPELQEYLTLNDLRRKNLPAPDGVAEHQGRPVLYFVDEQRLTQDTSKPKQTLFDDDAIELPVIFRQLACRGERSYLARVQFGKILVAPVSVSDKEPNWQEYSPDSIEGRSLFSRLAYGINEGEDFAAGDVVFDRLFTLLKHVANKIAKNERLRPDALSLVGRALFFRFLRDRGVLDNYPVKNIAPRALDWTDCFRDPANASDTCKWLDKTFNGDFLSLTDNGSEKFFERVGRLTGGGIFHDLSAVVRGHQPAGNFYQPLLNWDWPSFDFAHIPVGLLSQVYEAFSWEWTPKDAKDTSQRYTPRNIAVTLLDELFDKFPRFDSCRVLDPACGAGVFLVLAFRRIYLELWRKSKSKERPGTGVIRRILDNQLVGLDISEAALKLSALSLYLTAIELDPQPQPPDKLRFKNLRGHVLHNVREAGARKDGPALGSLSPHLKKKFDQNFDIVVSNPPWTSLDDRLGDRFARATRAIVARIDKAAGKSYQVPDNNPDLPFLWKSTEWCKEVGRVGMALPARLLLKTEAIPSAARTKLFDLLQIDGIINGTNLADTPVWPEMNQPWILLFATNKRPAPGHSTFFVTLPLDLSVNKAGAFRIDSKSTYPVQSSEAMEKPWLWKSLSIGTALDVDIVEKMRAVDAPPLHQYWEDTVGKNREGKGYQIAETQEGQSDSSFLVGLPNLDTSAPFRFVVDSAQLPKFTRKELWRPRKSTIYDPPLALVRQSPGEDREAGRALLAFERLAYHEVFNGYSAAGHENGEELVRYLHLFVHSDIWQYYLLATSPEFGAERRRARKSDLDKCPFIPFENLRPDQHRKMLSLSEGLSGGSPQWLAIDAFFAELYGLSDEDLDVVRDTLEVALPYDTARQRACAPPTTNDSKEFRKTLSAVLTPFVAEYGTLTVESVQLAPQQPREGLPFGVLVLSSNGRPDVQAIREGVLAQVLELADKTGATQVVLQNSPNLVVGIYNQYRYWTPSRATLLAADIVRYHLDVISG
jgi:hypothetical protein